MHYLNYLELSMVWYSLGADYIENAASNYTSIVARGLLPSNAPVLLCVYEAVA
jgi:hypothetical protein